MKHVRKLFSALLTLALVCALVPLAQAGKWGNNGHFANNGSFKNEHDFVNGASGTILNEGEFLNSGAFSNANTASNAFSGTKKLLNRGGTVAGLGAGAYENGSGGGTNVGSFTVSWKSEMGSFGNLEWSPVDGAEMYEFVLTAAGSTTPLASDRVLWSEGQSYEWDAASYLFDPSISGTLTLTVSALDGNMETLAVSNGLTIVRRSTGSVAQYNVSLSENQTTYTLLVERTAPDAVSTATNLWYADGSNMQRRGWSSNASVSTTLGKTPPPDGSTLTVYAMTAASVSGDTWSVTTTIPSVKTYNAATGNFETQGSNGSTDSVTVSVTNNIVYVEGTGAMRDYTTPTVDPTLTGARPWLTTENAGKLAHAQVGDGVTAIGDYTFAGLSNLDSVTIDNSVERIGNYAFTGDIKLTGVALPSELTTIGEQAFYGTGLTALTLPAKVATIGAGAFKQCASLATVVIPASVESIGAEAFSGCAADLVVNYCGSSTQWGQLVGTTDVFGGADPMIYFDYNSNSQP